MINLGENLRANLGEKKTNEQRKIRILFESPFARCSIPSLAIAQADLTAGKNARPAKGFLDSRAVLLALFEFRPENNRRRSAIDVCKNARARPTLRAVFPPSLLNVLEN